MSKFKILLAVAALLVVLSLIMTISGVSAGEPGGGGHGIISAFL